MSIADIKKNTESKMAQSISALNGHLSKIRTGRANPALLDTVVVDYYGNPTPINQVANVTLLDARTIGVTPWDKKMAPAIEKAIRSSELGLNPAGVGETVLIVSGSSARMASGMKDCPIDAAVVGIVDTVEVSTGS